MTRAPSPDEFFTSRPADWNPIENAHDPLIWIDSSSRRFAALVAPHKSCILNGGERRGVCIPPPIDGEGYPYANVGNSLTAGGTKLAVGIVPMNLRHAEHGMHPSAAAAHYAHNGMAAAIVHFWEDDNLDIWATGVLAPKVTDDDITLLSAAALSGDWRWSEDSTPPRLRMITAQAVNTPGFRPAGRSFASPIGRPRQFALAASADGGLTSYFYYDPLPTVRDYLAAAVAFRKGGQFAPGGGRVPASPTAGGPATARASFAGSTAYFGGTKSAAKRAIVAKTSTMAKASVPAPSAMSKLHTGTRSQVVGKLREAGYGGPTSYSMTKLRQIADQHAAKLGSKPTTIAAKPQSGKFVRHSKAGVVSTNPGPVAAPAAQSINVSTASRAALVAHLRANGYTGPVSHTMGNLRAIVAAHAAGTTAVLAGKTPRIPGIPKAPKPPRPLTMTAKKQLASAGHQKAIADAAAMTTAQQRDAVVALSNGAVTHQMISDLAASHPGLNYHSPARIGQQLHQVVLAQNVASIEHLNTLGPQKLKIVAQSAGVYVYGRTPNATVLANIQHQPSQAINNIVQSHAALQRSIAVAKQAKIDADAYLATFANLPQGTVGGLGKVLDHGSMQVAANARSSTRSAKIAQVETAYKILGHDRTLPHGFVDKVSDLGAHPDIKGQREGVVYRGVTPGGIGDAGKIVHQMASGTHHVGDGIYGQGTYSSPDINVAKGYAGGGGRLMAYGIRKQAKVVKYKEMAAFRAANNIHYGIDDGVVAMRMGADIMRLAGHDGNDHYVIYNRDAIIMVRPKADGTIDMT